MRFPDEEPDVDEGDRSDWVDREDTFAPSACARCGNEGHRAKSCPTVTPDLLKG